MPVDRGTLIQNTRDASKVVLKDGNISRAQFEQMTDGTVSRTDIANAEKAYAAAKEKLENAALLAANTGDVREMKAARDEMVNAQKLVQAVKAQHAQQGYLETGWENSKDAVVGS